MAGLDCAEVSPAAWPSLRDGHPRHGHRRPTPRRTPRCASWPRPGLAIGESGAAPLAALRALASRPGVRGSCATPPGSARRAVSCLVATEGATDPDHVRRVLASAVASRPVAAQRRAGPVDHRTWHDPATNSISAASSRATSSRIVVAGDLDVATVADLRAAVAALAGDGMTITLDLDDLSFIDLAGVRELVRLKGVARHAGWKLELAGITERVRQVAALCGLQSALVYP